MGQNASSLSNGSCRIAHLTGQRVQEWQEVQTPPLADATCKMTFLRRALDDIDLRLVVNVHLASVSP